MEPQADRHVLPVPLRFVVVPEVRIPCNIALGLDPTDRLIRDALSFAGFVRLKVVAVMILVELQSQTPSYLVDCAIEQFHIPTRQIWIIQPVVYAVPLR